MLTEEEVIYLIDAYNNGRHSFAEVILASGWTVKELCRLIREKDIPVDFNIGFKENGKGLDEEELQMILNEYV